MSTDSVLQVRMDSRTKKDAEQLFERLGLSITDAVRIFISQSLEVNGLPFDVKLATPLKRELHAFSVAHNYADPAKVSQEKQAWAGAVREKYETT